LGADALQRSSSASPGDDEIRSDGAGIVGFVGERDCLGFVVGVIQVI